jgi:hypothetical protein
VSTGSDPEVDLEQTFGCVRGIGELQPAPADGVDLSIEF